jgi:purine catabolism regulator
MRQPALVRTQRGRVLALIGLGKKQAMPVRPFLERLHEAGRQASGNSFGIGYSSVRASATEAASAAREAEQALAMGIRLFGANAVAAFADLGLYRLLYGLQGAAQLKTYCQDTLEALRKRDKNGVLLETLEAYLATNGSPTEAAERLHLHRNTVLYRLERIEELLGVRLKDAEVRLSLHLALKIRHVLEEATA